MIKNRLGMALLLTGLIVLIVLPVVLGGRMEAVPEGGNVLVIVTPHNEQIRTEFGLAFDQWHRETYSSPAHIAWSVPGGTSEIRAMLESQWIASLDRGETPGGFADLVFGGGSYEHGRLRRGVDLRLGNLSKSAAHSRISPLIGEAKAAQLLKEAAADGAASLSVGHVTAKVTADGDAFNVTLSATVSVPADIKLEDLQQRYGRETVGGVGLWDPEGYWFGTALSSFGLIANIDEFRRLEIDLPSTWTDLADPRLQGFVSLVNPAQSGSVTTAFETLLGHLGWERGWQVLRRAAANARTISASSLRGPMDVAAGDAAVGVCIDFFGRAQSQALADQGAPDRIRYIDPAGQTTIDPDPVSMLANPPSAELANRFIEFTLSNEAQALWQMPPSEEPLGPRFFALRRIPITDAAWTAFGDQFIDAHARPGDIDPPAFADRSTRAFIAPLLSAMALDQRDGLASAWNRIVSHPAYPPAAGLVTADDVEDPELRAMLGAFDAMPVLATPDGDSISLDAASDRAMIKSGWLRDGWREDNLWNAQQRGLDAFRQEAGRFFRKQYAQVRSGGGA